MAAKVYAKYIQMRRLMTHVQLCIAVGNLDQNRGLLKLMVGHRDAEQKLHGELEVGDVLHGILANGPEQQTKSERNCVIRNK